MSYDDCPAEGVAWVKTALLDTLGVALAGSREPAPRLVSEAVGTQATHGDSLLWGSAQRTGALQAALVNGTAVHSLDFDDSSNTMFGHPSGPMVAALLALGEERGLSGKDLILAYFAGFEVEMRIARVATLLHYDRGWHSTATLGVFGVAAACARMMALPANQVATALALATSFASGIKANFGSMAKPMHAGHCAYHGLFAARLADSGFTANPAALEHREGFFNVFDGPAERDYQPLLESWGTSWDLLDPGIAIKQYPCCGSTHASIDIVTELVRRHDLSPEQIAGIETRTSPRSLGHTNRPDPKGALDAKFSLQYCVARAVFDGTVVLEHFEDGAHEDPAVRALASRVRSLPHEGDDSASAVDLSAEVTIITVDGQRWSHRVESPLGRGPSNPLPPERLAAKFKACASRALEEDAAERLVAAVTRLEDVGDLNELTSAMERTA